MWYLPVTAVIDLCSATLSASSMPPLRFSAVKSADQVRKRPMPGVKRTYDGHHETDASDLKPTIDGLGANDPLGPFRRLVIRS